MNYIDLGRFRLNGPDMPTKEKTQLLEGANKPLLPANRKEWPFKERLSNDKGRAKVFEARAFPEVLMANLLTPKTDLYCKLCFIFADMLKSDLQGNIISSTGQLMLLVGQSRKSQLPSDVLSKATNYLRLQQNPAAAIDITLDKIV